MRDDLELGVRLVARALGDLRRLAGGTGKKGLSQWREAESATGAGSAPGSCGRSSKTQVGSVRQKL